MWYSNEIDASHSPSCEDVRMVRSQTAPSDHYLRSKTLLRSGLLPRVPVRKNPPNQTLSVLRVEVRDYAKPQPGLLRRQVQARGREEKRQGTRECRRIPHGQFRRADNFRAQAGNGSQTREASATQGDGASQEREQDRQSPIELGIMGNVAPQGAARVRPIGMGERDHRAVRLRC